MGRKRSRTENTHETYAFLDVGKGGERLRVTLATKSVCAEEAGVWIEVGQINSEGAIEFFDDSEGSGEHARCHARSHVASNQS